MRGRTIREGSVGLLILLGIGMFGGLVLWLRGLNPGQRNYQLVFEFENTLGMQAGTAVRYRGVPVGRVLSLEPSANSVAVNVEITQSDLVIPRDSLVEANQSGLIGETTIDITPQRQLNTDELALNPTQDCNSQVIFCQGDRIQGEVGASYEALLRSAEKLANTLSDPQLVADLQATFANAAVLTDKASAFTDDLSLLTQSLQTEVKPLATSARQATDNAAAAAKQLELTGREFQVTGQNVNNLISTNRTSLNSTLVNINRSSEELLAIMDTVSPAIQNGQFIQNLEALASNAALAAADVRNITSSFNTPTNIMLLQQTLESARSVFQNAQKVLSDVDELTGDPTIRNNLRNLINGLSGLVSSTQQLEQQTAIAEILTPPPGNAIDSLTLTATNDPNPAPNTVLMSYNGQLYRIEANTIPAGVNPQGNP